VDEQRYRAAERVLWAEEGATPTERFVVLERSGCRIRVQELGEGLPTIFVHGGMNSGTSWAALATRLSGRRCILVDRPGCGLSAPLADPPATTKAFCAYADVLVPDVLDALELELADVVATSLGSYFALHGAAAQPARTRSLALLGYVFGAPIQSIPWKMRLGSVKRLGAVMAAIPPTRGAVRSMLRQAGLRQALDAGLLSDAVIDLYHSLLRDTDTMRNEMRAAPQLIRPLRGLDPRVMLDDGLLGRVTAPIGLLWGDGDPFGGASTAQAFALRLHDAELEVLPGAGHAPWLDAPDRAAEVVGRFLDR
jgi:pimeloyl-ACP methyl ester carboxylesterase